MAGSKRAALSGERAHGDVVRAVQRIGPGAVAGDAGQGDAADHGVGVRVGDRRRAGAVVDEREVRLTVLAVLAVVLPSEGLAADSTGASLTVNEAVSLKRL